MPANGETVTLPTSPSIPVGISLGLLKREMAQGMRGRHAGLGGAGWGQAGPADPHRPLRCLSSIGLLPDAKKPRLLHGTLIMKDSVSVHRQSRWWGQGGLLCP